MEKEKTVPKQEALSETDNKSNEVKTTSPAKKNNCCLSGIIVFIILLIITISAFVLIFFKGKDWILEEFDKANKEVAGVSTETSSSKIDQNLIGNWDTGCLIPDPDSPWAEQHTFTINSDGTANHKRLTGENCTSLSQDHDENYTLVFPASGQINLVATANNVEEEQDIYDTYQVSDTTLKFGHGFCNCSKLCSSSGGATASDRISCLNDFLVYKKQ